jgi:glycosyltransferase involved in cell wall biosynthesis
MQAIQSILPLCDEFVIAVGNSTDGTREAIVNLGSPKIKIVDTVWDESLREGGRIFAQQANLALDQITGDWGFHIQADEVIHEQHLDKIHEALKAQEKNPRVEGFLFDFLNFFGSYNYIGYTRRFHRREIRIIRNGINARSYRDSQGFRKYPAPAAQQDHPGIKLHVKALNVPVFHYSYVRPPKAMMKKAQYFNSFWHTDEWLKKNNTQQEFNYYQIDDVKPFTGTHPALMRDIIARHNQPFDVTKIVHNFTPRERFLYEVEKRTGWRIGEYKNYKLI